MLDFSGVVGGWWGRGACFKKKKIDSPISFEIIRNCVGVV